MRQYIEKASILVEALPYIQEFRDSIVVVKFGGSAMESEERRRGILRDIVFMECAGMRPVLVHGGGKAISGRLAEAGIETRFINGLRYTCGRTIEVVDRVLHQEVNAELVEIMSEFHGRPFAMSGKNVFRAEPLQAERDSAGEPLELGYVGKVVNVDSEQIKWVLNRREVPVITPLAKDMNGAVYNVNADMAACRLAGELQARKLVFLSDVPGVLRNKEDEESLIPSISVREIESLIDRKIIGGGMAPKIRSAAEALGEGAGKVHLVDGRVPHSLLLEIFTDQGIGTEIVK